MKGGDRHVGFYKTFSIVTYTINIKTILVHNSNNTNEKNTPTTIGVF